MIRAAAVVVVGLAVLACSGDDVAPATSELTTSIVADDPPNTTAPPSYTGDRDSPFCVEVLEGADRPVLDPFAAGLDAREIELRMRSLVVRFDQLADLAPVELADDLDRVSIALESLDSALADHGYDLGAAGDAGTDLSTLNDPAFVDVGARVAAYADQVCRAG